MIYVTEINANMGIDKLDSLQVALMWEEANDHSEWLQLVNDIALEIIDDCLSIDND